MYTRNWVEKDRMFVFWIKKAPCIGLRNLILKSEKNKHLRSTKQMLVRIGIRE